jgi:arylsulfatase A-like enzyme
LHDSPELTTHYDWPSGRGNVTEEEARRTRHAYFACVSYIDAQIGKVLDELDRLNLSDDTIVALWGDHGWHLNDLGVWGKMTLFDYDLRSPLIIRAPGMKRPGEATEGVVETCDLYPTLSDLCGLAPPGHLDGASLRPMLGDPDHPGKSAAISTYQGGRAHSLRTAQYRYTEYRDKKGDVDHVELYDIQRDPYETMNIADSNSEIVASLGKALRGVR